MAWGGGESVMCVVGLWGGWDIRGHGRYGRGEGLGVVTRFMWALCMRERREYMW